MLALDGCLKVADFGWSADVSENNCSPANMFQFMALTHLTNENHTPTPTLIFFGESRCRVGFSILMAVFALLEDALACGALGHMPGAPAPDLTMSTPTSIAAAALVVSTQPSAQTLLVHSFQSRHRHSIVMTLHIHVGPGLESFVRKTSFVFIVAILC